MQNVTKNSSSRRRGRPPPAAEGQDDPPQELRDRLAELLPEDALQVALQRPGAGGDHWRGRRMAQIAGRVTDAGLRGEHLGYPPGQAPPGGSGNHRNRTTPKTVHRKLGSVAVNTGCATAKEALSRSWSQKRQTRLAGLDEKILSLYRPAGCQSGYLRAILGADRPGHDQPRHRRRPG